MVRPKWFLLAMFATAGAAAGCAVPSRDNPSDPQNRLPFRAYVSLATGERTDIGSHGAVWTLDASEACPNGCSLDFDIDGNAGNGYELSSDEPVVETTLVVASDAFAAVQTISRRLSVRRSDGARGDATVVLTNSAPVAVASDRFLPSAMGPETVPPSGIPQRVTLDACGESDGTCSSSDPDGDPITFVWKIVDPDGSIALESDPSDATGARVSFTVPGGAKRVYLFELEVRDRWRSSRTISRVFVGPQVWLSYEARLVRVATMPSTVSEPANGGPCYSGTCVTGALAFDAKYGGSFIAYSTTSGERVVAHYRDDPYFPDDPAWSLPGPLIATAGSAAMAAEATHGLVIVDGDELLLLDTLNVFPVPVALPPGELPRAVTRAGDGTFWVVTDSAPGIFDPATGTFFSIAAASLDDPITAAPGPDESVLIVDRTGASHRLVTVQADGATSTCTITGVDDVAGVADGPQESTWLLATVAGEDELRTVLIDPSCAVELVSDFTVPQPTVITSIPREGSAWVLRSGVAYHVRRVLDEIVLESVAHASDFATPATSGSGGRLTGMQIDPRTGNLLATGWFGDAPRGIVLADIPLSDEGVREIEPGYPLSRVAVEPTAASIWTDASGVLRRITPGGRVLATASVSGVTSFAAVSDGGAWVAYQDSTTAFGLVRIDASGIVVPNTSFTIPVAAGEPVELRLSAVHEATGKVCALTKTFDPGLVETVDGPAYRIDLDAGVATPLSPVPSGAVDVAISFEDACWWIQTSPASAHRVDPLETASRATALASTPLGLAVGLTGLDFHAYIRTVNGMAIVPFWDSIVLPVTGVPAGTGSAIGIGEPPCYGCYSTVWITAGSTLYRGHNGDGNQFVVETSLAIPEAGPRRIHVLPGDSFLP